MPTKRKQKIAGAFQKWLLVLVLIAFFVTTAFLWISQTKLAVNNAINILKLNIADVNEDINDASDENLLSLAHSIAEDLNNADIITDELLKSQSQKYDVTEINYIDKNGIIKATTYPDFKEYDMESGKQSAEFLV